MSWLVPRLAFVLAAAGFGAFLALAAVGDTAATVGALAGAVLALAAIFGRDALRGWRLMAWLRGDMVDSAPRDAGFWGELAYRIERALRQLERHAGAERTRLAQFVLAMEASPNGVLLLDGEDRIEWCNARAADHFGLDPDRDRRQHVTNLIRAPEFVAYLQAQAFDRPVAVPAPRGRGALSVLARRYGDDSKLVLSEDLTERERSDAMRRDFVANVSHEIRTPLSVLSGFLETMRTLSLDETERKRVLALMSQQADRMAALVSDLLTLAQLEGSPRPPADRWVRVAGLFALVEAEARALSAGRHAIAFAAAGDAELAGTEAELRSAIANLVNNAVRYTPDGGRIEIGWRQLDNGGGEVTVADSGRGIAREHLPRLTERFYRVDGGRSRESGGTGLGLAIVKHVVERHGGELDIASEAGVGSTFRFRIPPARVRAPPPSGRDAAALASTREQD
ncbi:MAG: phosphate regulon sensor histidine kinase PhoR [Caldimonas sp.]